MKPAAAKKHIARVVGERTVYHTLRWCNRIHRQYWFTMDPAAVDGEKREDMQNHFDARALPEQYQVGDIPLDWIELALLDGFEVESITLANLPPPPPPPPAPPIVRTYDDNDWPF